MQTTQIYFLTKQRRLSRRRSVPIYLLTKQRRLSRRRSVLHSLKTYMNVRIINSINSLKLIEVIKV